LRVGVKTLHNTIDSYKNTVARLTNVKHFDPQFWLATPLSSTNYPSQRISVSFSNCVQEINCRLEFHRLITVTSIIIFNSMLWVWEAGNFNCQQGKRACESVHGDLLSDEIPDVKPHARWGKFSKIPKRPNEIIAAELLLKTAKFS